MLRSCHNSAYLFDDVWTAPCISDCVQFDDLTDDGLALPSVRHHLVGQGLLEFFGPCEGAVVIRRAVIKLVRAKDADYFLVRMVSTVAVVAELGLLARLVFARVGLCVCQVPASVQKGVSVGIAPGVVWDTLGSGTHGHV